MHAHHDPMCVLAGEFSVVHTHYYSMCVLAAFVNLRQARVMWKERTSGEETYVRLTCGQVCGGIFWRND